MATHVLWEHEIAGSSPASPTRLAIAGRQAVLPSTSGGTIDPEQLIGEGRSGPCDPLVMWPALDLHEGVVDVHSHVQKEQVVGPLGTQTGAQRSLGPEHFEHVAVALDAPSLVTIDHSRHFRVAGGRS